MALYLIRVPKLVQRLIFLFLGSDPGLMHSPPSLAPFVGQMSGPQLLSRYREEKKGATSNFMPCCSVTQSPGARQRATVGRKTIIRPNLEVVIFNMCSDNAARLPDSMTHLVRVVYGEI